MSKLLLFQIAEEMEPFTVKWFSCFTPQLISRATDGRLTELDGLQYLLMLDNIDIHPGEPEEPSVYDSESQWDRHANDLFRFHLHVCYKGYIAGHSTSFMSIIQKAILRAIERKESQALIGEPTI